MTIDTLLSLRSALFIALGLDAAAFVGEAAAAGPPAASAGLADAGDPQFDAPPGGERPSVCSPEIEQPGCTDPGKDATSCLSDAECSDHAYGKCVQGFGMIGPYCKCEYACANDNDCPAEERCVCADELRGHSQHSACVPAQCTSGEQCATGVCELSLFYDGCRHEAVLACRTVADECASDGDCTGGTCAYDDQVGAWTCQYISCIFGRPLVIAGAPRVARTAAGDDWLTDLDAASELSAAEAARLGAYWTEVAALEHASVASFARFTLELLGVGAPPELVADTQRAALDEVEHARLAWSLASAYLGRPVGPGPLRVDDVAPARSLAQMVASLVKEGCVGETLGAAEAEAMAAAVGQTGLGAALRTVAGDEQRHAALAWRTLRWLVARHGDAVRGATVAAVAEMEAELVAPATEPLDATPGLLSQAQRMALRRATLERVIRPILAAVVGPQDARA